MTRTAIAQQQNLILQSENFDNASWTKSVCSITVAAIVNPIDGALTGQALVDTTANTTHVIGQTTISVIKNNIYTASVYAKAGTEPVILISFPGWIGGSGVYVNLTTGAKQDILSGDQFSTVYPLANGWYRVTVTGTATATGLVAYDIWAGDALGNVTYAGTGGQAIYIYGAQFTNGTNPGPYTKTLASAVNTGPIRSIVAQSENLLLQSQNFAASPWPVSAVVVSNADTAPDGTMTASTITDNSAAAFLSISQTVNLPSNSNYTFSFFLKKTSGATVLCGLNFSGALVLGTNPRINTNTGVDNSGVLTLISVGNYWKCYATFVARGSVVFSFFPATGLISGGGDVVTATGTQTIWGMQIVNGNNFKAPYQVTTTIAVPSPIRSRAGTRLVAGHRNVA